MSRNSLVIMVILGLLPATRGFGESLEEIIKNGSQEKFKNFKIQPLAVKQIKAPSIFRENVQPKPEGDNIILNQNSNLQSAATINGKIMAAIGASDSNKLKVAAAMAQAQVVNPHQVQVGSSQTLGLNVNQHFFITERNGVFWAASNSSSGAAIGVRVHKGVEINFVEAPKWLNITH